MIYIPVEESTDGIAKVIYTSKDGKSRKVFNALDWPAQLVTHIPGTRLPGWHKDQSGRKIAPGILLIVHGDECILGISEVIFLYMQKIHPLKALPHHRLRFRPAVPFFP